VKKVPGKKVPEKGAGFIYHVIKVSGLFSGSDK